MLSPKTMIVKRPTRSGMWEAWIGTTRMRMPLPIGVPRSITSASAQSQYRYGGSTAAETRNRTTLAVNAGM